jgi:membrane dipeptidase
MLEKVGPRRALRARDTLIQLTYNARNLLGDGCTERTNDGLSDFGVGFDERMNELGIIVDLSHCGQRTSSDGIEVSRKPPAFTHTFCEALYRGHPRAKTDELIKAMSDRGGVTGIAALGYFIGPSPDTSIEDYLNHVDHAVKVGGSTTSASRPIFRSGNQGLGHPGDVVRTAAQELQAEYNVRWPPWIEGLDEPERFRNVARGLERRGYTKRISRSFWAATGSDTSARFSTADRGNLPAPARA